MRPILLSAAVALLAPFLVSDASAEPMFLSKQYTRCTACHYSPTGGGLLTPYGQLLSHRELSTTGRTAAAPAAGAESDPHGEQSFLYGALGDAHLGAGDMQRGHELASGVLAFGAAMLGNLMRGQSAE